jgi:type III secretory pathway lipoprotein EscJ
MKKEIALVFLCVSFFLPGCDGTKEVQGGLDGRQSIDVFVTLQRAGIPAEREKTSSGREDRYRVAVAARDYTRALEVLHEYGIPRSEEHSIESLMQPQTFAPATQEMSELRLDYALSLRVERLLLALPDVVDARVLVRSRMGSAGPNKEAGGKPSASVIIRYVSPSGSLPFAVNEVKELVAQAVPGLRADDILINVSRAILPGESGLFGGSVSEKNGSSKQDPMVQPSPLKKLLGFRVPEEDREKALIQLVLYLLLFCIAGGILGYVWGTVKARKQISKNARKPAKDFRGKNA